MLIVECLNRPGMPEVSFSLQHGQCLAVRGRSGSGKTLLLRAIADLDPSEGRVTLDGQERESIPAPQWRRRIAYVSAEPGWWSATPADHFEDWPAAQELVGALGLSPDLGAAPIAQLSTGERQRMALARTLIGTPDYLLLDEPTAALDGDATAAVEAILRDRQDQGTGILLVTHDPAQSERIADSVLRLDAGTAEHRSR